MRGALTLLLPALGALTWATPSDACSCAGPPLVLAPVTVEHGTEADPVALTKTLPTNGKIWLSSSARPDDEQANRIVDDDGALVDGSWTRIDGRLSGWSRLNVFHPDRDLTPGDTLHFQVRRRDDEPWRTRVRIPVGDGPDHTPPPPPTFGGVTWQRLPDIGSSSCAVAGPPPGREDAIGYRFALDDVAQPDLVVLEVGQPGDFDAEAHRGEVDLVGLPAQQGSATSCSVGSWAWTLDRAQTPVRWGAYDLAGHFSGWSAWETITGPGFVADEAPPLSTEGGCGGASLGPMLGLALVLRRRRLRPRR